jgi:hypothetical protein
MMSPVAGGQASLGAMFPGTPGNFVDLDVRIVFYSTALLFLPACLSFKSIPASISTISVAALAAFSLLLHYIFTSWLLVYLQLLGSLIKAVVAARYLAVLPCCGFAGKSDSL